MVWKYFPETARMSLEEIGEKFGEPVALHLNAVEHEKPVTVHSEEARVEKQSAPETATDEVAETV